MSTKKNEDIQITLRRKMAVTRNMTVAIPVDVRETWPDKKPHFVIFTVQKDTNSKLTFVTIEPCQDQ
jgi:bifunctional DNA-binding transcriptional regulator/antitoxin component of YhaV-PrlF toxin-antitoxin module